MINDIASTEATTPSSSPMRSPRDRRRSTPSGRQTISASSAVSPHDALRAPSCSTLVSSQSLRWAKPLASPNQRASGKSSPLASHTTSASKPSALAASHTEAVDGTAARLGAARRSGPFVAARLVVMGAIVAASSERFLNAAPRAQRGPAPAHEGHRPRQAGASTLR